MALPAPGTFIRHTYRGVLEYGKVTQGNCWTPVLHVPRGTRVVQGVWKRDTFHPRKTVTLRHDWAGPLPAYGPAARPSPAKEARARALAASILDSVLSTRLQIIPHDLHRGNP